MSKINILHLSDLHYQQSKSQDIKIVLNALWKDLEYLKKENLTPQLVVFSGDIVQTGDPEEFKEVSSVFIDELLVRLELSPNYFFIVPGNHDIQRGKIDEFLEKSLNQLVDRSSTNSFLDNLDRRTMLFDKLMEFNVFKKKFGRQYNIASNILYETFKLELEEVSIGIACLNSTWRATGKAENFDHGKLIIGERQIDNAVTDIKDCNLKIGIMHHPFEWLAPFETNNIKRRIFSEFDLMFSGHNHDPSPELIDTPISHIVTSNCGSLYQTREYYNGYTLVSYDTTSSQVIAYLRAYSDTRREFHESIDHAPNGKKSFFLTSQKEKNEIISISTIERVTATITSDINRQLISATVDSCAPKSLKDIFVEPLLVSDSKSAEETKENSESLDVSKSSNSSKVYEVSDLLFSDNNLLVIGKRESGKTTLLNYLSLSIVNSIDVSVIKIPFYVNCANIPYGRHDKAPVIDEKPANAIMKAIAHHALEYGLNKGELHDFLENGRCIFLFDDISFEREDKRALEKIVGFITAYPKNRYIFTTEENYYFQANLEKTGRLSNRLFELLPKIEKVYIRNFNRARIRVLIQNWFPPSDGVYIDTLLDNLVRFVSKIKIPRSPVLLSWLLFLFEKQDSFIPTNKASLLEKLIEIKMDKHNLGESRYANIDYRYREHYLSYLAYEMVRGEKFYFENKQELESLTGSYFKNLGMDSYQLDIGKFIDFFLDRGILVELDEDRVTFKYKCFREYFTAKRMMEDTKFYDYIIQEENYLDFINEIDYLTGIGRNNRELLLLVESRLDTLFEKADMPQNIHLAEFDNFGAEIQKSSIAEKMPQEKLTKLAEMNDKDRDSLIEPNSVPSTEELDGSTKREKRYDEFEQQYQYFDSLTLFSRIIRNCELIEDLDLRENALKKCLSHWAKLTVYSLRGVIDLIAENKLIYLSENQNETTFLLSGVSVEDGRKDFLAYRQKSYEFFYFLIPFVMQSIVHEELGSEKLKALIEHISDDSEYSIVSMFCVFLYADLKLPNYIALIKKLQKRLDDKLKGKNAYIYIHELILRKLYHYLIARKFTDVQRKEMESLISDIYGKVKRIPRVDKSKLLSQLQKEKEKEGNLELEP